MSKTPTPSSSTNYRKIHVSKTIPPRPTHVETGLGDTSTSGGRSFLLHSHVHAPKLNNNFSSLLAQETSKIIEDVHETDKINNELDTLINSYKSHRADTKGDQTLKIKDALLRKYEFFQQAGEQQDSKISHTKPSGHFLDLYSFIRKDNSTSSSSAILKSLKHRPTRDLFAEDTTLNISKNNDSLIRNSHQKHQSSSALRKSTIYVTRDNSTPFYEKQTKGLRLGTDFSQNFSTNLTANESGFGLRTTENGGEPDSSSLLIRKELMNMKAGARKSKLTLPQVRNQATVLSTKDEGVRMSSRLTMETCQDESLSPHKIDSSVIRRSNSPDPFSQLVKYQDGKVPFFMAIYADARQEIIKEVKKKPNDRMEMSSIAEIKDKRIPNEKANFLYKMYREENKKKEADMKSRTPGSNALCQMYAMDKSSQKKIMKKLEQKMAVTSRFLSL